MGGLVFDPSLETIPLGGVDDRPEEPLRALMIDPAPEEIEEKDGPVPSSKTDVDEADPFPTFLTGPL